MHKKRSGLSRVKGGLGAVRCGKAHGIRSGCKDMRLLFDKLEVGDLLFKNKFPVLCNFGWHHFSESFSITDKLFFVKVKEEELTYTIIISKLKFKFTFEIRKYRL